MMGDRAGEWGSIGRDDSSLKNKKKKKTCLYCGKVGFMEKVCWKKTSYLEEKVKNLEGDVSTRCSTNMQHRTSEGRAYNYMFFVSSSQILHAHTSKSEWIVDSGCTHHMAKDASLFLALYQAKKKGIFFFANDHALTVAGCGKIEC